MEWKLSSHTIVNVIVCAVAAAILLSAIFSSTSDDLFKAAIQKKIDAYQMAPRKLKTTASPDETVPVEQLSGRWETGVIPGPRRRRNDGKMIIRLSGPPGEKVSYVDIQYDTHCCTGMIHLNRKGVYHDNLLALDSPLAHPRRQDAFQFLWVVEKEGRLLLVPENEWSDSLNVSDKRILSFEKYEE